MIVARILKELDDISDNTIYTAVITVLNDFDNDKITLCSSKADYNKIIGICENLANQKDSHPRRSALKITGNQAHCLKLFLAENIISYCDKLEDVIKTARRLENLSR